MKVCINCHREIEICCDDDNGTRWCFECCKCDCHVFKPNSGYYKADTGCWIPYEKIVGE